MLNYTNYYVKFVRRFVYTTNVSLRSREVLYLKLYYVGKSKTGSSDSRPKRKLRRAPERY